MFSFSVGEIAESASNENIFSETVLQNTAALFADESKFIFECFNINFKFLDQFTGPKLYLIQLLAMLQRHYLNLRRNKARTIAPIFVSLLLFALFVGFGRFSGSFKSEQQGN